MLYLTTTICLVLVFLMLAHRELYSSSMAHRHRNSSRSLAWRSRDTRPDPRHPLDPLKHVSRTPFLGCVKMCSLDRLVSSFSESGTFCSTATIHQDTKILGRVVEAQQWTIHMIRMSVLLSAV